MMVAHLTDALFIGPMRAATTWIHKYLAARRDVCVPNGVKETFFFDRHFDKGLFWYEQHFRHYNPKRHARVVEVGASYFHCPEAPERIARSLGRPRLVVIVRDPVERSISHYRHIRRRGLTKRPILEAAKAYPELVVASRYATLLDRWERVFGSGAVQLLLQEELKSSPLDFLRSLCQVIDLPYADAPAGLLNAQINSAGDPPFFWLARVGKKVADFLRARRIYAPVEVAKAFGLKRLFFGSERSTKSPSITDEERRTLSTMLADDWEEMKRRLKRRSQSSPGASSRNF